MTRALLVIALAGCKISDATFTVGPDSGADAMNASFDLEIDLEHDLVQIGATENGQLVAVQDGDGPFVAVTGDGGVYRAHIHSDHYGVAIGCRYMPSESRVEVILGTAADGTRIQRPTCAAQDRTVFVGGDLVDTGISGGGNVLVTSRATSQFIPAGTQIPSYSLQTVKGPTDVFATLTLPNDNTYEVIRSTIDLEVSQGLSFDFEQNAVGVTPQLASVTPPGGDVTVALVTATGTYAFEHHASLDSPPSYHTLPVSVLQPGDLYLVTAAIAGAQTSVVTTGDPVALAMPEPLSVAAPVFRSDPYIRPELTIPVGSTSLPIESYQMSATTSDLGETRTWLVEMSSRWQLAAGVSTYQWPDLSDVAGFSPLLELQPAVAITCSTGRIGSTDTMIVEGRRQQISVQTDTL